MIDTHRLDADTTEVRDSHRFDEARLAEYLESNIEQYAGPLKVVQFKGGQSNPTFGLITPKHRYVLRRKPLGKLLPSAHAVDREYRVLTALSDTGVPVARTWCLCEDESVLGSSFYVMDWVEGRVLWDPSIPGATPSERAAIFDEMNRVIAALHTVDVGAVGLADYGKPGNYFERQISRWSKQYRASETRAIASMERLMDWLPRHVPPGDEVSVVHGDYRLDNLMLEPNGPRVRAVLDWELSTLGHPLADFSYHCMTWHLQPGVVRGLAGQDLAALGIPNEAEYVATYCRRAGREPISPADWSFYLAYNMFRFAGILQGIAGRVVEGTAASPQAMEMAAAVEPIADIAWRQVESIRLGRAA
ncbi:MAG: phosphotransferase family protein [Hydrocarboniphaga sp.]|uniref:phosphotransferase n=1 Tax=Hydrocarboniphaga sp. TaxID=2033016 RepID=UPI002629FD7E|nr:phosphotransferase [Hydrocarboniphaga sp.]MDB5971159.1 phosphotransferase family protein [Hydrocarboniphaga sp.]